MKYIFACRQKMTAINCSQCWLRNLPRWMSARWKQSVLSRSVTVRKLSKHINSVVGDTNVVASREVTSSHHPLVGWYMSPGGEAMRYFSHSWCAVIQRTISGLLSFSASSPNVIEGGKGGMMAWRVNSRPPG